MAKQKIKNFKLEQDELKPMTIGIFESRRKSSVGIFVLLTLFILLVVFLPQISDLYNKYFNHEDISVPEGNGNAVTPIVPPDREDDTDNNTYYELTADLSITKEDIKVDSFYVDINNNTLSFKVTNITSNSLVLSSLNYYLELYTSEHTLLERIKVNGNSFGGDEAINIVKTLGEGVKDSLGAVVLAKIDASNYPAVTLGTDSTGSQVLVCSREHEKVTYSFKNNLLKEVSSVVSYSATDNDYVNVYQQYFNLSLGYNGRPGIASSFLDYNNTFTVTTNVNLKEAERATIFNADTFELDTDAKVVNFEMEAEGFSCE